VREKHLFDKALRAAESAAILLDAGDTDGACDRAYYAMFSAACAALLAEGREPGKTHKGVLSAVSANLIKDGPLPKEMGRLLKRAEILRYVSDYHERPVGIEDAREMVDNAKIFLDAVQSSFGLGPAGSPARPRH